MDKGPFARRTPSRTSRTSRTSRARQSDGGLGPRLPLACLAVFLVVVPFAVLLALVDARWTPLRHLDDDTILDTHSYVLRHPALEGPLRATAVITHPWVFRGIVLLLAVWLALRGRWRLAAW